MLHGSFWHQNVPYLIYKEIQQYLKYDLSLEMPHLLALIDLKPYLEETLGDRYTLACEDEC